jgi:hypothetical protein
MKPRTTRWSTQSPGSDGLDLAAAALALAAVLLAAVAQAGDLGDLLAAPREVIEREVEEKVEPIAFLETVAGDEAAATSDTCRDEGDDCRNALGKLRGDRLADIDLDIRVGGRAGNDYPCECRLEGETFQQRRFASTMFTWKAAGYCHKPLYFEHWTLERYGHSRGFVADSFCSAAHFFVTLPVLPYKMGVELPWECVYPLGYYRPGSCAPWTVPAVPVSPRGFAVEAATITGLVFLLP